MLCHAHFVAIITHFFPSCSLPCFKIHKSQCELLIVEGVAKRPAQAIGASCVEESESAPEIDLSQDPQFQQLFEQFPTLRARLKWIYDASQERPNTRQGSGHDRFQASNYSFNHSQLSPERRLDHLMQLLDKELKAVSAETNGIRAFADLVAQALPEKQVSI